MTDIIEENSEWAKDDEIEIISALPIEVRAWSRDIVFAYKGKTYDVTQWYSEDEGTSFTWNGEKLNLFDLFDDPGMTLDTLASDYLEDKGIPQ
jgi:hypothetical protein